MEIDLDNNDFMMMMKMRIIMIMMITAVTQSVFKLGPPNFPW